jgi:hypothetical protein
VFWLAYCPRFGGHQIPLNDYEVSKRASRKGYHREQRLAT